MALGAIAAVGLGVATAIEVQTTLRNAAGVQDNKDQILSILTRLAAAEAQGKQTKRSTSNQFTPVNCSSCTLHFHVLYKGFKHANSTYIFSNDQRS